MSTFKITTMQGAETFNESEACNTVAEYINKYHDGVLGIGLTVELHFTKDESPSTTEQVAVVVPEDPVADPTPPDAIPAVDEPDPESVMPDD